MDKKRLINQRAVAKSQLTRINVFLQNFERGSDTTPVETTASVTGHPKKI
jgi:hypothetical protein